MTIDRTFTFRLSDEMYEWLKARAVWRDTNESDSVGAELRLLIRNEISKDSDRC